jgi:hypothetical protein
MEFDVEEWQRLARDNPEEFERRRAALIETAIAEAPPEHQQRLRGLQFRIDLERRKAKTPLGAAVRLQSMMWERLLELREALLALSGGEQTSDPAPRAAAQILPFPKAD